ncbi:MAG: hypothetical protein HUU50_10475 [Candidatus Brocadiae bacterium]|nr:hypothetical protein [Candidatus Brocadiia bacterium]
MKNRMLSILILVSIFIFMGCDQKQATETLAAPTSSIPSSILLKSKPDGSISIIQARASVQPGAKIVISGEIGGRKNDTFGTTFSTFFLADPDSIINCFKKHEGETGCPTPWDYCCEPKEKVLNSIALVQYKSPETGKIHNHPFKGWQGLKELSQVTITGTVDSASSSKSLIINLEGIYIHP